MGPSRYFAALSETMGRVEATDEAGRSTPVDEALERVVELMELRAEAGGKILFIGNGGSAAIASHQAVDYWKNGGLRALAFNDASLLTCVSNDCGYASVFEKPVSMFADAGDVLAAISSSGRSPNIHAGVAAARGRGCAVLTFSGFAPDNPLRAMGDWNFFVPSSEYGVVEISHLALIHCALDWSMARRGRRP